MNIAKRTFLFDLSSSNIELFNGFKIDDDYKINPTYRLTSKQQTLSDVSFSICKEDFVYFLEYIEVDLLNSKNLFYINIDIDGSYKKILADIISNIKIELKDNIYKISFKIIILDINTF